MPKSSQPRPLPEWHAYMWDPDDRSFIIQGLCRSRSEIAELLGIGLDEVEAAIAPGRHLQVPQTRHIADYIAMRNDRSQLECVPCIDLAIDEIAAILQAFMGDLSNVNALASEPQIYRTLNSISKRQDITEEEIILLDPRVRELLATHHPGGRERFTPETFCSKDICAAAQAALVTLPEPTRGRPKGSSNHASDSLMRELANLYRGWAPSRPARSVVVNASLDISVPGFREGGQFLAFCELVIETLPPHARKHVTRSGGSIATLVRSTLSVRQPD